GGGVAGRRAAPAVRGGGAIRGLRATRLGRPLVLVDSIGGAPAEARRTLVGRTGRALTPLRPAGKAELDGARVDVVTDGDFVDAGQPVAVVRVEGMKVVVRRTEG